MTPRFLSRKASAGSMDPHRPEAWSAGMRWIWTIAMVAAMTAVSAGCASKTRPSSAGGDAFSGSWAVRWCDETRSEEDCGGFWLTLVQKGRHVCGEYDGAWMNLTQVDEGRVTGVVHGDSATLRSEERRVGNRAG